MLHKVGFVAKNPENDSKKMEYLYSKVIARAIAGTGIFDAPHCLSSVCLFLRPLVLHMDSDLWKTRGEEIADICLAMVNHDRSIEIPKEFISKSASVLRVADEFQEWDRDTRELSYVEDVVWEEPDPKELMHLCLYMTNIPNFWRGN